MTSTPASDFPHPYVAVDVVLLAVVAGSVRVLLVEREDEGVAGWGLPGAYLQLDERISETRTRVLHDKGGSSAHRPVFVSRHKHQSMWRWFRQVTQR